jgi:hypothetical protein
MSHEVCFQKAGLGFLPLLERADGNLLFEQRSCSHRREAAQRQCALGPEEAIRRCCAHGKQLPSALFRNVEMFMALKRFNECGEKGDKAFGADAVGGVPSQKQRMLDLWPILSRTRAMHYLLHLFCMVEKPPGVCPMVSSRCHKGIQQRLLL